MRLCFTDCSWTTSRRCHPLSTHQPWAGHALTFLISTGEGSFLTQHRLYSISVDGPEACISVATTEERWPVWSTTGNTMRWMLLLSRTDPEFLVWGTWVLEALVNVSTPVHQYKLVSLFRHQYWQTGSLRGSWRLPSQESLALCP